MLVKGGTVGNGKKKLLLTTKSEMWESSEQSQNNSVESLAISSKEKLPNTASPLTDRIHPTNYAHGFGFNTLRATQNRNHFTDDIFKGIFFNENIWIPNKISLKFVPKGPINNILALVAYTDHSALMNYSVLLWLGWVSPDFSHILQHVSLPLGRLSRFLALGAIIWLCQWRYPEKYTVKPPV